MNNLDYSIIFGAANSSMLPSSSMQTRTHAEKSLSISLWAQEMALSGILRVEKLTSSPQDTIRSAIEGALLSSYAAAGFSDPAAALQTTKDIIITRFTNPIENNRCI